MANAATIGALRVVLGLDTAQFESGLLKAKGSLAAFNPAAGLKTGLKELSANLDEVAGRAGIVGKSLLEMGVVGVGAAVAIGGVVEALRGAREALEFGDQIASAAKKIGVSTDTLQEYRFAVHDLGGSFQDADAALDGFSKKFALAQIGFSKRSTKPFEALGLDPKSFATADEALQAVIQKISALGSTAQQNAIAEKLGLETILPAIRAGGGAIDELRQKAHELGYVMSAELVEKAESANKKFEDLSAIINVQFKSAFVEAAPALLSLTEHIADLVKWLAELAESPGLRAIARIGAAFATGGTVGAARAVVDSARQAAEDSRNGGPIKGLDRPVITLAQQTPAHTGVLNDLTPKGPSNATASDEAIARAAKAELDARIALTADIAKLAVLRLAEVDQETAAANRKLQDEATAKKISQASAARAIALNNLAAGEKKALIVRQAEDAADNENLAQRKEIGGYLDQAASIQASLAKTAAARNAIEAKSLADQQRLDRRDLKNRLDHEVASGLKAQADADVIVASQADAQAAARQAQERQHAVALQEEENARAEAALQLQIDILKSQADAASTDGERRSLQLKILALEQLLERTKLQEVVASEKSSQNEKDIANARLGVLQQIEGNQHQAAIGSLFDAFGRAESGVSGLANAFKSHDWGHVVSDLVSTFQSIKADIAAGNAAGAAGGIGSAVGSAVGGVAGSTISGIASGASLGFSVGGPIGAGIGAIIGGIAGFFSGNSAKKAQEAANAQAAAQAAAAHATAVANEKTQLQIAILQSEGKAEEALALQRQQAIASVNAENRDLEAQLLDLQAAADKAAQAAAVASQNHELQIKLLTAEGDATGALAATRADELAALDASNRGLQEQIYKLQDLADAQAAASQASQDAASAVSAAQAKLSAARDAEATALTATVQKFQAYADSLTAYAASLAATDQAAAGSYAALDAAERRTAASARLGDPAALAGLQDAGAAFLAASRSQAHSLTDFLRDQARVKADAEAAADTATRQVSIAQQQLDALNAQVDGLIGVKDAVLTIPEAIANLQAALEAQTAAQAAQAALAAQQAAAVAASIQVATLTPPPPPPVAPPAPANIDVPPDIARQIQDLIAGGGLNGIGGDIQRFATGGSFTAGGSGGPDSQLYQVALTPGEVLDVSRPGDLAALADAVRKMDANMQPALIAIAKSTGDYARRFRRVVPDGVAVKTSAA